MTLSAAHWVARLEQLGLAVRRHLRAAADAGGDPARPVAHEGGDTIYALDRHVEPVLEAEVARWPAECRPLWLVAEGLGRDGRRLVGGGGPPRFRVIVDPIDGTRGLMYDKRPAWFIAAVAPDRGDATSLHDCFAAALVELPVRKQGWADSFATAREEPVAGRRVRLDGHEIAPLPVRPSAARTLRHGFGHVASFFPGTKVLAAELMERIAEATVGPPDPGAAAVFDDQYISTAGQMVELMTGRDRFCADLRPLFHRILARRGGAAAGLACHPYDVAGALVAERAGVIVTDGFGRPLDAPLDVHSPVHWCGYANAVLQAAIEPVIQEWLAEHGVARH
jgi:hypothetical protein